MINKNLFRNTRRVSLSFKVLVWFDLGICIFLLILFVMSTSRYEILKTKQNLRNERAKIYLEKVFVSRLHCCKFAYWIFPKRPTRKLSKTWKRHTTWGTLSSSQETHFRRIPCLGFQLLLREHFKSTLVSIWSRLAAHDHCMSHWQLFIIALYKMKCTPKYVKLNKERIFFLWKWTRIKMKIKWENW